jgi:class 3 adenylate cyclase
MEEAFGPQHGAGELAAWLDRLLGALAEAVARHHGSIVAFAGDAITCWFDGDHRLGAVAAALEMQAARSMAGEAPITAAAGTALPTLKVALAREARVA